jgi:hypothetical protein
VKGNVYLDLADKNIGQTKPVCSGSGIFRFNSCQASGNRKYSGDAATSITKIKYKLINSAIADSKESKHSTSANKLYEAYLLDRKDTINLYYAASTYVNANE